jgi:hypothetical protein
MPDGFTAKITANNHTSCAGCHNLPQGTPGGGTNFHKDSGFGRQAPHYFGAGIAEMLALQIRAVMLQQLDRNKDGWVSSVEAPPTPGSSPATARTPSITAIRVSRRAQRAVRSSTTSFASGTSTPRAGTCPVPPRSTAS